MFNRSRALPFFPLKPIKEICISLVHQAYGTLINIKMPIFILPYFKIFNTDAKEINE